MKLVEVYESINNILLDLKEGTSVEEVEQRLGSLVAEAKEKLNLEIAIPSRAELGTLYNSNYSSSFLDEEPDYESSYASS